MAAETELERLVVRLVGDAAQYEKMLQEAQQKTQDAASKIEAVGAKLEGFAQAAAQAIGVILAGMSFNEVLSAFHESEMAVIRLDAVLESNGRSVQSLSQDYRDWATAIQGATTYGDEAILSLVTMAESFGLTGDAAKKATQDAMGFAAINNSSAEGMLRVTAAMASGDIERAMMFSRMIPQLRGVKNEMEFLEKYQKLTAAGATVLAKEAETASGRMKQIKESFGDLMELVGAFVAETIGPVLGMIKDLVKWLQELPPAVHKILGGLLALVAGIAVLAAISKAVVALKGVVAGFFAFMMAHPFVAFASAIGIVIAAVVKLTRSIDEAVEAQRRFTATRTSMSEALGRAMPDLSEDPEVRRRQLTEQLENRQRALTDAQNRMTELARRVGTAGPGADVGDLMHQISEWRATASALEESVASIESSISRIDSVPAAMSFNKALEAFNGLMSSTEDAIRNMGMTAEEVQRNQLAQVLDPERIQQLDDAMARLNQRREQFQLGQDAQGMLKALKDQYDTFGMTARQADVYRLRLRDTSGTNREAINEIERLAEALDAMDEANKAAAKSAEGLAEALKGVETVGFGSLESLSRIAITANVAGSPNQRLAGTSQVDDRPREMVRLLGQAVTHLQVIARREPVTFEQGGLT